MSETMSAEARDAWDVVKDFAGILASIVGTFTPFVFMAGFVIAPQGLGLIGGLALTIILWALMFGAIGLLRWAIIRKYGSTSHGKETT